MPDLLVDNVTKEYPTRDKPLQVLKGVSLELSAGQNAVILGPSGSGKSTLLHVIGTLDEPSSGNVTLHGQNPFDLPEPELADFRNAQVGYVFQDHHLLPQLSVLENVLVPAIAHGPASAEAVERATNLIERVGLTDRIEHRPSELSGGERQRVAVARSLIQQPSLLLADEPTGNLDRTNAMAVGQLLIDLQQQEGNMLIVVTHSQHLADLLERRFELDDGRLK
jgi:lipoprotein-releasing system ATP-binding protein